MEEYISPPELGEGGSEQPLARKSRRSATEEEKKKKNWGMEIGIGDLGEGKSGSGFVGKV